MMLDEAGLYLPETVRKANGKPAVDLTEVGGTGLRHFGGVLAEEYVPALQGDKAIEVYREMSDNDPIVGGTLLAIDNLIRQVEWVFEPASPDREDQRWAQFMQSVIDDMSDSWSDTVSAIFSMLPYGWSYVEEVYKYRRGDSDDPRYKSDHDDGLVGWRKLPLRSQDSRVRWEFDDNGGVQGMVQMVQGQGLMAGERPIPIKKAMLFRTTSAKSSPEGRSILRTAYRPWYYKRRMEEFEGIGIERDLAGLPMAWVPPSMLTNSATPEEKLALRAIQELTQRVRRNSEEGIVFPLAYDEKGHKTYDFTLLSSGSKRQFDIDTSLKRKSQEIAICTLADWLLLGHDAVGSRALASPKIDVFTTALETWTKGVGSVFDAHGTPRLLRLNGVRRPKPPKLVPAKVEQVDLNEFATVISTLLSSQAVTGDIDLEDWVRTKIGAPPRREEEGVPEPQRRTPPQRSKDEPEEES